MKNKNSFFLTVLESGKIQDQETGIWFDKGLLSFFHIAEGGRSREKQAKCCKKPFYKDLIPINKKVALLA